MPERASEILRRITAADRRAADWTAKRDALIVEAHRAGAGLREIASACNLSHMTIKRIINKENPT